MKINQTVAVWALLVFLPACAMSPQGPSADWETLNAEVLELHRTGQYDRAADVATTRPWHSPKRIAAPTIPTSP